MLFPSYLFSLLPSKADTEFNIIGIETAEVTGIENGVISEKAVYDFNCKDRGWFNYYGISYKSDTYIKGVITYIIRGRKYSEEYCYLRP